MDFLPVDQDAALVGTLHAVEDLHERGLAGAVLADDGVDLCRPDRELHVLVGDDTREPFANPDQLDGGDFSLRHSARFLMKDGPRG